MSRLDTDNPPYVTVSHIGEKYYAVLMEYVHYEDEYRVSKSKRGHSSRADALIDTLQWSKDDGYEVRL